MRLSKSKCLCYEQCPYRYKLQFIDQKAIKTKAPQLQRGIEVHSLIENYYKSENIEEAMKKLREHEKYEEHKVPIENIISFSQDITSEFLKPIHSEIKLFNEELNFSGILDAVFKDDNDIMILDWKTGRKKKVSDHRFELALYAWLLEKQLNIKATHWGICFIDHKALDVEPVIQEEIDNALDKVRAIRECIAEKRFNKQPGWQCKYCDMFLNKYCNGRIDDETKEYNH